MTSDREELGDMVAYAVRAMTYVGQADFDHFASQEEKTMAVRHCLFVIGEAANRVSEQTRSEISELPWHAIRGMRNRLAHGYNDVTDAILFRTVETDLPPLVASLRRHLDAAPEQP